MPLPVGIWRFNLSGSEGQLNIQSVDAQGLVVGTLDIPGAPGNLGVRGTWNEAAQCFTFSVTPPNQAFTFSPDFFRGFLFSTPRNPPAGLDVVVTVAGTMCNSFAGQSILSIGSTSRRNEFGWTATQAQVV